MKALRGQILEFLYRVYPSSVLELDVISVFFRDHRTDTIRKALAYLVDRGYVEKAEKDHPVWRYEKQLLYKLTSNGVDLMEGTKKDPGVMVEDRRREG